MCSFCIYLIHTFTYSFYTFCYFVANSLVVMSEEPGLEMAFTVFGHFPVYLICPKTLHDAVVRAYFLELIKVYMWIIVLVTSYLILLKIYG